MSKPLWRALFDSVDHGVAGPIEAGTRSEVFGDLVAVGWRLNRRVKREIELGSCRVLHLLGLPAAADVRRLSQDVAALRRELRAMDDGERGGGSA
jgi:hypothetical protein